ncbi:Hsp20 family protein [Sphingomonas crocodyli]|uniref:Hsp20 family protein n=1 Tax=Sphingomonas crocodyli TaxID=1979270 RepID=A0A437LYC4_9SPHN|nr:Hsp20 family protein [Sphingomonas crocodyli]RVT90421.1 Hsp20 family protein [Sphingomonas crocodyli]
MRTNFDFTPFRRSSVGFDTLFDLLESGSQSRTEGFPAFNLEKTRHDQYRITLAVPGFSRDEIEIVTQPNQLIIKGLRREDDGDRDRFLHRGIAHGSFERRFQLADYIEARSARLVDGLLTLELARDVPDAMKPRRIEIGAVANDLIEGPREAERAA